MNMTWSTRRWLGLLAMLCAAAPAAADLGYQVEAIVFERNTPETTEGTAAGQDAVPPDFSSAVTLDGTTTDFQALSGGELQLSGVAARLRKSGYSTLVHTGWRQSGDEIRAVRLTSADLAAEGTPIVDGALRLRVSRQLSVIADLIGHYQGQPMRLAGQRIVKFGELHYFDHPVFGLLVQVTRYKPGE